MAEDIVTRLRDDCVNARSPFDVCSDGPWGALCVACQAADEIERLRADRDRWHDIANGLATYIEKASSNNARALQDYDNMVYKEIYGD